MRPLPWRHHLPPGARFEPEALTRRRSLPAAWAEVWSRAPGAPLLLDAGSGASGWCRAGEFEERTRRLALRLRRHGVAPGQRLLWSTRSSVASVAINVAALRAGVVVVPANPEYTARELAHLIGDVRPALAVVDDPARARLLDEAAGGTLGVLDTDLRVVVEGAVAAPSHADGGRRGDHDADGDDLDRAGPEDPALIAYTSGTTGRPKGAVLTHANLLANSEALSVTWRWEAEDRLVHALPVFHGHGLCVALYTSLLRGSSVVLLPRFEAGAVADACAERDATLFFGVPTMFHRLVGSGRAGALGRLRLAVSGSAPLPAELHAAVEAASGQRVLERYGMTETLMTLSNPCEGERRPGTVGFPFPGVEAEVEPAEGRAASEAGGGEILVRGPALFAGYWQRPAATEAAFTDGWFRTGDLATVEDGYVRILGRASDLIISGGYNVYPAEVEDVLMGHPGVAEVAVTGTPSDEWGEVVTAWVVADGSGALDPDEVAAFAAPRLAPYKRPRLVRVVDALPRNALGKVQRSELR
ncbi:MAG TPA: acyl-CoA synthetase [Acidimicrobiales bacterium]|nr:acyl-CoA synthetase [Acidimicrobiales bacterium]